MTVIEKKRVSVWYMALVGSLSMIILFTINIVRSLATRNAMILDMFFWLYGAIFIFCMALFGTIGGLIARKFTSKSFLILLASLVLGHIAGFGFFVITYGSGVQ